MSAKALILGVSGQDGSYLAELLLRKGYEVHGTSRDAEAHAFPGLTRLGIRDQVRVHSASLGDFRDILEVVTSTEPDEIYNLAGQSSVGLSFSQPRETFESLAISVIHLLEVLRYLKRGVRLYNACSSECFGDVEPGQLCDERTPFRPLSPYAVAKSTAFWQTASYRAAYGLHACSGILFNHESPLRPARFVTRKIIAAAARISQGSDEVLELGNLAIRRDWGYAPDYVEAMWRMLQRERAEDYVIASGNSHSLQEFVEAAFAHFGLDWHQHVRINPALFRPSEIMNSAADPRRARAELGWTSPLEFPELIAKLAEAEYPTLTAPVPTTP